MNINEIHDRLHGIMPGKWSTGLDFKTVLSKLPDSLRQYASDQEDGRHIVCRVDSITTIGMRDINFISHAPEDIKFLLDLVEKQSGEIEGLKVKCIKLVDALGSHEKTDI